MQTERVTWINPPIVTNEACFICGNTHNNKIILKAKHWHTDLGILDVASCAECHSAWFIDARTRNTPYPSTDIVLQDPNFIYLIYHYLEVVGGLDWKIGLLERLPFTEFNSVMEIGCNAGVALDYCRTMWDTENIVGLEPSAYGVIGSHLLSLPIIHDYMSNAVEILDKTFDFIFATEVLEHVSEPLSFLADIKKHLSENGICLLTTPRSTSLNKATPPGELYAALSPGAHYFLLSPNKLEDLARQVGFSFCHIEPFGMTNVAILSNKPISLTGVNVKERLLSYYQKKTNAKTIDDRTRLGHLINCYTAEKEHRDILSEEIHNLLLSLFFIDIDNPISLMQEVSKTEHLIDFGKTIPFSLPFYLYAYANNLKILEKSSKHYMALARAITTHGMKIDFQNLFVYHDLYKKLSNTAILGDRYSVELHKLSTINSKIIPELAINNNSHIYKLKIFFSKLSNWGKNNA